MSSNEHLDLEILSNILIKDAKHFLHLCKYVATFSNPIKRVTKHTIQADEPPPSKDETEVIYSRNEISKQVWDISLRAVIHSGPAIGAEINVASLVQLSLSMIYLEKWFVRHIEGLQIEILTKKDKRTWGKFEEAKPSAESPLFESRTDERETICGLKKRDKKYVLGGRNKKKKIKEKKDNAAANGKMSKQRLQGAILETNGNPFPVQFTIKEFAEAVRGSTRAAQLSRQCRR